MLCDDDLLVWFVVCDAYIATSVARDLTPSYPPCPSKLVCPVNKRVGLWTKHEM